MIFAYSVQPYFRNVSYIDNKRYVDFHFQVQGRHALKAQQANITKSFA